MTSDEIQKLMNEVSDKHHELVVASERLKLRDKSRFVALGLLDYYLTKISPGTLAEYRRAMEKGKV